MRRLHIAAAAAALVVLAGGGGWLAADLGKGESVQPAPAPAAVESRCGLSGTAGTPTAIPATWETVAGYQLPISATDGPGVRDVAGAWSCYSRTPAGAVLAGYIIPMRAEGIAEDWPTVIREQTVPGAGQTTKLRSTPAAATEPVELRGFSISGYTEDRATIAYYLHTPSADTSCTADLRWLDGDWRLQLREDGSSLSGCTFGVPESFTPWGP